MMDFEILRKNRDALLAAELGVWLHNVGKMHPVFIDNMRRIAGATRDQHSECRKQTAKKYQHDLIVGAVVFADQGLREAAASSNKEFGVGPLTTRLKDLVLLFTAEPFNDVEGGYRAGELIDMQRHEKKEIGREKSSLTDLMKLAHAQASGGDKRSAEREEEEGEEGRDLVKDLGVKLETESLTERDKETLHKLGKDLDVELKGQAGTPWYGATAFGWEGEVAEEYREELDKLAEEVKRGILTGMERRARIEQFERAMGGAIADSKRPINDVRVSDMGFAASAFFKAGAALCLLKGKYQKKFQWRFARVAVNGEEFFGACERIPDLLARQAALAGQFDAIREELEVTTPLGQEVFRDWAGPVFLVPDLGEETGPALKGLIDPVWKVGGPVAEELSYRLEVEPAFSLGYYSATSSFALGRLLRRPAPSQGGVAEEIEKQWTAPGAVCAVCGLRPVGEGKAGARGVCGVCEARRQERSLNWLRRGDHTIWTEEVADRNGRVALIAARFRLEPWLDQGGMISQTLRLGVDKKGNEASKSESFARLRRVWRTCERFWDAAVEEMEKRESRQGRMWLRFQLVSGHAVASHAYLLDGGETMFSVVAGEDGRLWLAENEERTGKLLGIQGDRAAIREELKNRWTGKRFRLVEPQFTAGLRGEAAVVTVSACGVDGVAYAPVIPIERAPERLMVLAPADRAMEMVESMRARFEGEMGKVWDRLGMDIGLAAASSAMPVRALLEAGRRLIGHSPKTGCWEVKQAWMDDGARRMVLEREGRRMAWRIPLKMGDGQTDDEWYARMRVMEYGEEVVRPAREVEEGDRVLVEESLFDFEFLDSAGRRFEIAYEGERPRRMGRAAARRPYTLEEVDDLKRAWDLVGKGLATSQLKALDGLLAAKREEWGEEEWAREGERWAWQVLMNLEWTEEKKPVEREMRWLARQGAAGTIGDAVELYLAIPKSREEEE